MTRWVDRWEVWRVTEEEQMDMKIEKKRCLMMLDGWIGYSEIKI